MDKSIRFWDRFAERYVRQPIADPDTYRQKLQITQQYLTQDSRVLEFGCGTGSTALVHAPKVRLIVAIDSSQKMVEIAEGKLKATDLSNLEFRCATVFDLPNEDASFDAVLGLNVLHLIDNYRASIQKTYQLLKPGGVFVSSTVCMSTKLNPLKLILPLGAALGLVPKVLFISVGDLERNITECGFTLIEKLAPPKRNGAVFLVARK